MKDWITSLERAPLPGFSIRAENTPCTIFSWTKCSHANRIAFCVLNGSTVTVRIKALLDGDRLTGSLAGEKKIQPLKKELKSKW